MHTFNKIKKDVGIFILEKYNYTCCSCRTKKNLCIHHVKKMDVDNPNYNDKDNLIVLCRKCHMKLHRINKDILPTNTFKKGIVSNPNGRRGNNPEVFCKIENCCKKQHARSLCKKHYEYYRKHKLSW